MRKSFSNLKAHVLGEIRTFKPGIRYTVAGVCSRPVSVIVEGPNGGPLLFKQFPPGDFSFDVSNVAPFALWFDADDEAVLSVEMPRGSEVVKQTRADSLTDMSPRPALNPQMEALLRKLNIMESEIGALRVRDLAKERKKPASPKAELPKAEPVAEPEAKSEPAQAGDPAPKSEDTPTGSEGSSE